MTRDRVFLSYAHENLEIVRKIYEGLKKRDVEVWFDKSEDGLGPGRWKPQIEKAISRSKYFVIFISKAALRKTGDERPGFQDVELNRAYNIAEQQSDQDFAIIPVRLEDCGRGDFRLSSFQQYDLFGNFDGALDRLSLALGEHSLSKIKAKEAPSKEQQIYEIFMGKATTAYYAGEFEKSVDFFKTITRLLPDYAEAWYSKGVALDGSEPHGEALVAYDRALKIDPDHFNSWFNKGLALCYLEHHGEALATFDQALKINPDHTSAWVCKGNVLSNLGREKEAVAAYSQAIKINPDIMTIRT